VVFHAVDSMYTMLAAITGGIDWVEAVRPLEEIHILYRVLWMFYIVFVVIGVLNVLTGIFVERACEISGLDKDLVVQTEMKRNEIFQQEMKRIFVEADADHNGSLSWEEFKQYMEEPTVQAYFATKQLDAFDARSLYDILHEDKSKPVSIETFILGCQRLKGIARSVDLLAVLRETRETKRTLKLLMRRMDMGCMHPENARHFQHGCSGPGSSKAGESNSDFLPEMPPDRIDPHFKVIGCI